jgi:hypothetical protein
MEYRRPYAAIRRVPGWPGTSRRRLSAVLTLEASANVVDSSRDLNVTIRVDRLMKRVDASG